MISVFRDKTDKTRQLRGQLQAARNSNNLNAIKEYSFKLAVNNAEIVDMLMDFLERVEKSDTDGSIASAINSAIHVQQNAPVYIYSPDRRRRK